jgi:hypothetical protein
MFHESVTDDVGGHYFLHLRYSYGHDRPWTRGNDADPCKPAWPDRNLDPTPMDRPAVVYCGNYDTGAPARAVEGAWATAWAWEGAFGLEFGPQPSPPGRHLAVGQWGCPASAFGLWARLAGGGCPVRG